MRTDSPAVAQTMSAVGDICKNILEPRALEVLREWVVRLGSDHFRQAMNWAFLEQRIDFIAGIDESDGLDSDDEPDTDKEKILPLSLREGVLKHYWSSEHLAALFPDEVADIVTKLQTLLTNARAAVEREEQEWQLAHAENVQRGLVYVSQRTKARKARARIKTTQANSSTSSPG